MKNKEIEKELKQFGGNVRQERLSRKITQEKLAELSRLNVRTRKLKPVRQISLSQPPKEYRKPSVVPENP